MSDFEKYWAETYTEVPFNEWGACEYAEWSSNTSVRANRNYGFRYAGNKTAVGPVREILY